jgi:uncharacterized coiled-coil protein SlyX
MDKTSPPQNPEQRIFSLLVAAEEQQKAVAALTSAVEREIATLLQSQKALDASVEALPATLKTAVSSAVQDVVGRLAASAAKPIAEAAAPLARDMETAATAASTLRKNLTGFAATLVAMLFVFGCLMLVSLHVSAKWTLADNRDAIAAAQAELRRLEAEAKAGDDYIVTLNAQIVELRDKVGGLIWERCGDRRCIQVAKDQTTINPEPGEDAVYTWKNGTIRYVIPEGF